MPMHRRNKCARGNVGRGAETPWFVGYRRRSHQQFKAQRLARRIQRQRP